MSKTTSSPRIKQLPAELANQIAAGEVIERPASVVKELIENSLDAGATKIEVYIEDAGIRSIIVKDNGHGIHKEDLTLALCSHATSKLRDAEQLQAISSLGFRGEALPSIASVSRFTLTSREANSDAAWSIDNEGELKPDSYPLGTIVTVEDLFYNIPGRRKFLKTERTESLHIQALIRNIALSHFGVTFVFIEDGQKVFHLHAEKDNPENRIQIINGKAFMDAAIKLETYDNNFCLRGWLGSAEQQRSSSDRQYFFVNGRMVKDKLINHAIRIAYGDSIYSGRYPSYVLHLDINPAEVDVNVHPAKHEVRFRNGHDVHDFISASISQQINSPKEFAFAESQVSEVTRESNRVAESIPLYKAQTSRINPSPSQSLFQNNNKENIESIFVSGYLIAKFNEPLFLIDIKQFRQWQLRRRYELAKSKSENLTARPILVPINIQLTEKKVNKLIEAETVLQTFALELQQSAPDSIMVRTIPALLNEIDITDFIHLLSDIKLDEETILQLMCEQLVLTSTENLDNNKQQIILHEVEANLELTDKTLPWRELGEQELVQWFK